MSIEKIRFEILSQDNEKNEPVRERGERFQLKIKETADEEEKEKEEIIVSILARYVGTFSEFYTLVIGEFKLGNNKYICDAKYDTVRVFPENTPIGSLVAKRNIKNDF